MPKQTQPRNHCKTDICIGFIKIPQIIFEKMSVYFHTQIKIKVARTATLEDAKWMITNAKTNPAPEPLQDRHLHRLHKNTTNHLRENVRILPYSNKNKGSQNCHP